MIEKRAHVHEKAYSWDPAAQAFSLAASHSGNSRTFLKGPIPWWWIIQAAELPGKALIVGLCLWRLRGATKKNVISLGNSELKPFRVDRAAKSRALSALEEGG